jgi:carotenoid 1,2-hydratase
VEPNGYAWWYLDAVSDDAANALTVIAFVGSVFSPYYAHARRHDGEADPYHHCAFNVALYGKNFNRWSMTERGRKQLHRAPSVLSIGKSAMRWTGDALELHIDEICAPWPQPLRGRIRLIPSALGELVVPLDSASRHHWVPYAPCSRIDVEFTSPRLRWSGNGYFDANFGVEPLESAFSSWHWSRTSESNGSTVLYQTHARDGVRQAFGLRFKPDGAATDIPLPPLVELSKSGWRIARQTRADPGTNVRVLRTFENAPFYSRALLQTSLLGTQTVAMHESVDLNRFNSRWVQCLLPFRMPRFGH